MKVSLRWLKDYVDISLPLPELAEKLTLSGTEVKSVQTIGESWEKIVVGQVVSLDPHPNADRLQLVTVDIGEERVTVVSGAPNLQVGAKVPFAPAGARLIDGHTGQQIELKEAKIRGVVSRGMVCSEKELGISEEHQGIMLLPPEAPVGAPLADYLGDAILDLEITPNRPDCLCLLGVAQEIAALTAQKVRHPRVEYEERGAPIEQSARVEIADPDLCPRYCASLVLGVKIGPSPRWMQQRLLACGMRPINNVVDVTNYVLLEYGQPLHAFDFHRIVDQKIIVRRAREGERIITLDGVERALSPGMLLITDPLGPIAIAGVMGGAGSEVSEETSAVLLESANFNPVSLRRTSRELRLRTEASLRFEKGLSPELPLPALRRATQLILELAGGEAAAGIIDVYPGRREREPILLTASQVKALLGIEVSQEQIITVLESLGFACQEAGDSRIWVRVPYWRSDVNLAADLAEEVARIIGYDQIPVTMLSSPLPPQQPDPLLSLREKVRDILAGCGLQEVITYSLTSREKLEWISPSGYSSPTLRLANPMSTEQELLRTTLRPGLLSTLAANQRHEPSGIRIFEVGKIYLPREKDLPREQEMVAAVLSGPRLEPSWFGEQGWLDFFDAKGVVETLLQRLGVSASFESSEDASFHPGKRARIVVKGTEVGVVGELHPQVAENFDLLPRPVSLLEIELEKLLPLLPARVEYKPLPRFPSSVRDLAIVVDREVPAGKIQDIISSFPLVSQVVLFDLYTGEPVPPGKKSLAFRITYQSPTHTLTDEEVHHTQQEILTRLEQELGATLRQ